ncbi:MAG: 6-phosphofructokinase [Calditrichaeota bacterium]|nr:MAG: 6-phosphofructokinase [Calditrichota bacterium]
MSRVGILTCGGDCPGLNAAIRAVTRKLIISYDFEVLGVKNGYDGLIEGDVQPLSMYSVSGVLPRGGTILGTSRTEPFNVKNGVETILENLKRFEIDSLVVIGGKAAINSANQLSEHGIKLVCIPSTIDNDVYGTDVTLGFDTAVNVATKAIDMIHTTAESHHRIMVVELMGLNSGWIATYAGLAGGADCILIPEVEFTIDETAALLKKRHKRRKFSIVVVAEGANPADVEDYKTSLNKQDALGNTYFCSIGEFVGAELAKRTGMETRVTTLGYIQRGGSPSVPDRILASRLGVAAANKIKNKEFSVVVGIKGNDIIATPLKNVTGKIKQVNPEMYNTAAAFFG